MNSNAQVIGLVLITSALVGCSKKSASTTASPQQPSGVQVVTNVDGSVSMFQTVIKRNTNIGRIQQEGSSMEVVTHADGSVSVFRNRLKQITNSGPVTTDTSK